jgi:hypothetical protein
MLNTDGVMAFVTPTAILNGFVGKRVDNMIIENSNVSYLSLNRIKERFFSKIGLDICYYIVSERPQLMLTIEDKQGKQMQINRNSLSAIPTECSLVVISIMSKCFEQSPNYYGWSTTDCSKLSVVDENGDTEVVKTVTSDFKPVTYRVNIHNKQHRLLNQPKVMWSLLGRKAFVDYSHNLVPGAEHCVATVPTSNDNESENLLHLLTNSKLVDFYAQQVVGSTRSAYCYFIRNFKSVDLSKKWTDEELYTHFGLNQQEIDYIETD